MTVNSSILDIVILLGAVQGFIISVLLYLKKEKIYANRFLAAILFLIALACLNIFLLDIHITNQSTFWTIISLVVPLVIVMPIGPLIYFYTLSVASPKFKVASNHRAHFYPVVLDLIPSIIGIVFVSGALLNWIPRSEHQQWGNFLDNYNTYVDLPRWISACIYTWLSWKELKSLKQNSNQSWPTQFVIGFFIFEAIWSLHLVPYLIPSLSNQLLDWVGWYPVYIPLTVMVYWLGLNGYLRIQPSKSSLVLDEELVKKVTKALQKAMMEDRLYLKPELNLSDVVNHTNIQQKTISAVLNQHLEKSFNEFVNEFRIADVKRRLLEPGNDHLTITGIALECGFNSQATFQRTFKQSTGQSPREFQQSKQETIKNNSQI